MWLVAALLDSTDLDPAPAEYVGLRPEAHFLPSLARWGCSSGTQKGCLE